ncbi:MAG: hypothetical protein RLZZ241_841, partial [Bacteroidota bacterium]
MRKTIKIVMALALILGVFYFYIMQDFEKAPATLFTNGNILTLNEVKPKAQALYVKDGQIVAIGTEEALNRQFPDPELRVDLKGATVMPGFIDPHSHFSISLFMSQMHDLSGFTYPTNLEVRSALVDVVAQTPDTEWILGKGIDPVLTRDLVPPSLDYLDSLAPNNPVLLFSQSLHSYWANSAAFKAVGIDKNTPNPSISSYYAKDTLGNLNGLIVEQVAIKPFLDHIKKHIITPDRLSIAASQVMLDYAKNGNTTVVSAGITIQDKNPLLLFRHLSTNQPSFLGKLLERIGMLPKRKP